MNARPDCGAAFVEDAKFLRASSLKQVKYTLPGPMTMVDTLYDGYYKSREKLAREFAVILNEEAREIAAAGIDVVQFDSNCVVLRNERQRMIELLTVDAGRHVAQHVPHVLVVDDRRPCFARH